MPTIRPPRKDTIPQQLEDLEVDKKRLRKEITKLQSELDAVERSMQALENELRIYNVGEIEDEEPDEYDPTWTLSKKAKFILSESGKTLTLKEILDKMLKYENGLEDVLETVRKDLSSRLNSLDKAGKGIKKMGQTDGKFKFGLTSWFDEKGYLKFSYK